jgi:hypothetical protein
MGSPVMDVCRTKSLRPYMWQEEIKVVVLIFLLIQYCRSENVLDLAEKLSRLENEMTSKITELQTEMIRVMTESEKLKRSMEILQDGNRLFDTRINSLNYIYP